MSLDSAVRIEITLRAGRTKKHGSIPVKDDELSSDSLWSSPSFLFNGYQKLFWG